MSHVKSKQLAEGQGLDCDLADVEVLFKHADRRNRRQREDRLLHELTVRANSGVLLTEILDHCYESFRRIIPYDRMGLALLESQRTILCARWARAETPDVYLGPGYSADMRGSSLQQIIESGRPRILNDLEAYLRHHENSESTRLIVKEGMRSSLTCPLFAMGKAVGFLFFSSATPGTYQHDQADRFMKIADQISLIVEKGRLFEDLQQSNLRLRAEIAARMKSEQKLSEVNRQLEATVERLAQMAARDGLTGVANRRIFEQTLEKEWNRCLRSGKPISLILIDVDFFKLYNDVYGHLAGDECLKLVAQSLLLSARRSGDLVARYGGEEFAMLLPEATLGAAFNLAEKMKSSVEDQKLAHRGSPISEHVTISLGICTMQPRKDLDRSILVATADLALYEAKDCGRNRIVVSPASVP